MEAILKNFEQGIKNGLQKARTAENEIDFPCIKSVLDQLLTEAQQRFPIGSEVPREEIIAWIGSRYIHWSN